MTIISLNEFNAHPAKYLNMAVSGEDVQVKLQSNLSVALTPITTNEDEDFLLDSQLKDDISQALRDIEEGRGILLTEELKKELFSDEV